LIQQMKKTHK